MKIVILGSGAMGCRFALSLKKSGADVVLCDIWKEHVDAINANGLQVVNASGTSFVPFEATTDIHDVDNIDAVVVFTKSYQTETAIRFSVDAIAPNTPVITLQNGLGNIQILKEFVGIDNLIVGVTDYAASVLDPGIVNVEGLGYTKMMALSDKQKAPAIEICRLLSESGMNCTMSDNIMKEIWEKVGFNCSMNSISSLTRQRVMYMGGNQYGLGLCMSIAKEVELVAKAEGIDFDYEAVVAKYKKVLDPNVSGNHITSMLQDVLKERPTEIDSICGSVIELGKKHGIETPHLETVYSLVKVTEINYKHQVR